MKRVINEVFPTVVSCQSHPYCIVSSRIDWVARRNRGSYRFVRPGIPIYDSCQSLRFLQSWRLSIILTHLNFFNGFEYDPTPEVEAMVAVWVIKRGGREGSGGFEKCRRKKDPGNSQHRRGPVANRAYKGTESSN